MIAVLFGVLEQGLKLANTLESRKYLDRLIKLRSQWNEEINKPRANRNNALLDDIEFELRDLSKSFIDLNGKPNV
jgi:hypothetical protein